MTTSGPTSSDSAFTIDTPTLEDVPALARIHVRGWEIAYAHLLQGDEWFGREAVERRITQWSSWLTPGTRAADVGVSRVGRDADGAVIGMAASWPPRDVQPVAQVEEQLGGIRDLRMVR